MNYKYILAPLAGLTDKAFRRLCSEFGADLTFTEMISSDGLVHNFKKTSKLLEKYENESNVGVQLFGHKEDLILESVKILNDFEFLILDFNVGCPVKKVFNSGSGAALLKDLKKLSHIMNIIKKNTKFPLSMKIRVGINEIDYNIVDYIIKVAEDLKLSFLTIHGRARKQMFSGKADWNVIKYAIDKAKIPIIGNGDIFTFKDAKEKMEKYKPAGIMIARGALSNPFIFKELKLDKELLISNYEKLKTATRHFMYMLQYKDTNRAIKEMRKFWGWYSKGMKNSSSFRYTIFRLNSIADILSYVNEYIESIK